MARLTGTLPNQVPTNADLGTMAYQDYDKVAPILKGGRRNMIINGDMQVAQRGTTATGNNVYSVDRWENIENTDGATTISQQSDGPYTADGHFKYYLQVNVDTADTSLGAAQWSSVFYKVEGYDFDPAGYGNSQAKTLTLSFWHCHSVKGTYSVSMRNDGGGSNRNFVFDYTQDVAGVWQKTIITFPGDAGGTWTETNTAALSIMFTFAQGSSYATSTLNQWFTGTYYHASTNIDNMMATTNAKFRLTGVQLELGNIATPFEHRSYGEELALCQRYYEVFRQNDFYGGDGYNTITTSTSNGSNIYGQFTFKTVKRARPSAGVKSGTKFRAFGNGSYLNLDATEFYSPGTEAVRIRVNTSGFSAGEAACLEFDGGNSSNGYIYADAEL